MKNDLITIAEYSKIRGCSTTATYKRLDTTLKPFIKRVGKKTYLSASVLESEGLSTVEVNQSQGQPHNERLNRTVIEPIETVEKDQGGSVMEVIKVLEHQIEAKDQEIDRLRKEIETLNQKLDEAVRHNQEHTDKLTELLAQSQELNRNNQIIIAQAQQKPELPDPTEKKKSWWRSIWE